MVFFSAKVIFGMARQLWGIETLAGFRAAVMSLDRTRLDPTVSLP